VAWGPDYCTPAELKHYARVEVGDLADDAEIGFAITAASRAIDRSCGGRQFGSLAVATEWLYTPVYDRRRRRWVVTVDDFATTTGLIVKISGVVVTDFVKEPTRAVDTGKVWTQIALGTSLMCAGLDHEIGVTAVWGWAAVPVAIRQACLLQSSRFLARRESPYGIAGSPSDGSELRLLATVDPDVRVAVGHYVRCWSVV
jgi:hypothetical protein